MCFIGGMSQQPRPPLQQGDIIHRLRQRTPNKTDTCAAVPAKYLIKTLDNSEAVRAQQLPDPWENHCPCQWDAETNTLQVHVVQRHIAH